MMSKAAKAIIVFCLCISMGLIGVGVWLIFTPETQPTVTPGNVNQNQGNIQNPQPVQPDNTGNQSIVPNNPTAPLTTTPSPSNNTAAPNTQGNANSDPSAWTQQQALDKLASAVNSTKASTAKCSVRHVESMTINITDCPGGNAVKAIITPIVDSFSKPEDETINFVNGKGTNAEGKAVTMATFPPSDKQFTLPLAGVQSISASANGTNTVITLKVKPENTTYASPVPQYNAASIGYLNLSSLDLPGSVQVKNGTFNYTGSTIVATINQNGLLSDIKFNLPMVVSVEGKVAFFSGTVGFTGEQVEQWSFSW